MIDATSITEPAELIDAVLAWLWSEHLRGEAEIFAHRAATVPGMDGLRQLCSVYHVPVRWHL